MRTSALQYLYLQKPISSIILICILSVLPCIFNGHYTDQAGKATEIATSMLYTGNWILPVTNAGEIIYQPPMHHWLITVFSLPQGSVSAFTAHLPTVIAYIILIVFVLLFYGRHLRFQEAFITTLLLITCVQVHWAGISINEHIVYAMFIVIALFKMYRWENKLELKGLPVIIPLLLSGAILTKSIAGMIYPLIIYGCYLILLRKYKLFKIIKSLIYICITSLFIPVIWYVEGWGQGATEFLDIALYNDLQSIINVGNFSSILAPFIGFLPWTILLLCSLFGLNKKDFQTNNLIENDQEEIKTRKKIKLFNSTAAIGLFLFILFSGKNCYSDFLPAYPFIAAIMAQYIIYLTENKSFVIRIFAVILTTILWFAVVMVILDMTNLIDISTFTVCGPAIGAIIEDKISFHNIPFVVLFLLLIAALVTTCYQLMKKINIKILYATIFLIFASYLFLDVIVLNSMPNNLLTRIEIY